MIKPYKKNTNDDGSEMSFLDHLEQLRWHIVRSAIAITVVALSVFVAKSFVFEKVIFAPLNNWFPSYGFFQNFLPNFKPPEIDLITREFGESFFVHIKVSLWLGLIVAFPYVFWEIWRFIKPGLYDKERKAARGVVFVCSSLFLLGVLFGYYVIAPFGITFLGNYTVGPDAINSPTLASYVSYLTTFTIPTGLVFELPVIVYFLARVGLVTPDFLKKYRKHALIIILFLAAIITPPDILTQFLIGIPVYFLYEISIVIAKRVYKKYHSDS